MSKAVAAIHRVPGLEVLAQSNVYETVPLGGPPQPLFLNAAVLVGAGISALHALDELQRIELEFGRVRGVGEIRFGPRTLDLDILWVDGLVLSEPRLVIPHPRLHERAFALVPMLEVVPRAIDPRTGTSLVPPPAAGVRRTEWNL